MATVTRTTELTRTTRETDIRVALSLDGEGSSRVTTGLGFLDHMLTALAFWSRVDLTLTCDGDLDVDDHHTVEDVALALGQAFDRALGERRGIERYGLGLAPMDEALVRAVVDLSGRPYTVVEIPFDRPQIGAVATENLSHFFRSFAVGARATIHVDLVRGANDHHKAEAAFKALALALRRAVRLTERNVVASTKGSL